MPESGAALPKASGAIGERAEDLVHQPEAHLPHALAAELGRQVRGPQPALLDLLLQRRDRLAEARPGRARARSPPAARSRGGRTRPSSRAALGSRGRWRSPSSCGVLSVRRRAARPKPTPCGRACERGARVRHERATLTRPQDREETVGRRDRARSRRPPADDAHAREGAAPSVFKVTGRGRSLLNVQHGIAKVPCQG